MMNAHMAGPAVPGAVAGQAVVGMVEVQLDGALTPAAPIRLFHQAATDAHVDEAVGADLLSLGAFGGGKSGLNGSYADPADAFPAATTGALAPGCSGIDGVEPTAPATNRHKPPRDMGLARKENNPITDPAIGIRRHLERGTTIAHHNTDGCL